MDLVGLVGQLARRWRLVVPLILVAAVCAAGAFIRLPTTYQAQTSMVLLANTSDVDPATGKTIVSNPYLSFSNSLTITGYVLARTETTDERAKAIATQTGSPAAYTIEPDPRATGPILLITATGTDKAAVARTLDAVAKDLPTTLGVLQKAAKAPADAQVSTAVVTESPHPTAVLKNKIVKTVLVFAVVFLVGLLLALLVGRLRRRPTADAAELRRARVTSVPDGRLDETPLDDDDPRAAPVLARRSS
jgi:polysaccharide biosynthesis protein PslJ